MPIIRLCFGKFLGALVVFLSVLLPVLAVRTLFPEEAAPLRQQSAGGEVRFVIQSERDAVSWPTGVIALAMTACVGSFLRRRAHRDLKDERRKVHPVIRAIYYALVAMLGFVFITVALLDPLFKYRTLTLDRNELRLGSLYRSWSIPIPDVADTQIERNDVERKGSPCTDLSYCVRDLDGMTHQSVTITCTRPSRELSQYAKFFNDMNAEIREKLAKK